MAARSVSYAAAQGERAKPRTHSVSVILHSLCCLYATDKAKIANLYKLSLNILGSHVAPSFIADEFGLSQRIQKRLVREGRERDAVTFVELHRRLSTQSIVKNRAAILLLLLTLGDESLQYSKPPPLRESSLLLNATGLSASLLYSSGTTPQPSHSTVTPSPSTIQPSQYTTSLDVRMAESAATSGSSGISSMLSSNASQNHTFLAGAALLPPYSSTPAGGAPPTSLRPPTLGQGHSSESRPAALGGRGIPRGQPRGKGRGQEGSKDVPESVLLRDIIFIFQNIEGDVIHYDAEQDAFRLDKEVSLPPSVRNLCHKLCELGWLYRRVCQFVDAKVKDRTIGLVCQSFCSALSQELTEYYRLIAVLEAQQQTPTEVGGAGGCGVLSLRRLAVWTHDPLERLKMLGILVDGCKRLKGGAMVSALYAYHRHGDPYIQTLVKHLLTQVYQPINALLNSWVFDGELADKSLEFFVACDDSIKQEKLWRSKYSLRHPMLPSFISKELATKILVIGKSINFLRQVCQEHTELGATSLRQWHHNEQGVSTFDSMTGSALQAMVGVAYQETSRHLLQTLQTKYRFMEHLKALRRYLLLGQGDFIRHLMDLLAPELSKPASTLHLHNLTGTLEAAVRATNAQFEPADILNRLDVRMLELSPGDQGWDVFSLHYHVGGPICTVFTTEAMLKYLRLFNFLWRAKRMEFCLANMWRQQTSHQRSLRNLRELHPVLHQSHALVSAMVHFITQLQYYVTFEVMECCWAGLVRKVTAAEDLDQVISAHDSFLEQITAQCLLQAESQPILTRLRAIFDLVIMFQQKQAGMLAECTEEVEMRRAVEEEKESRGEEGSWGTTAGEADAELERRRVFYEKKVLSYHSDFVVLHESFKDMVEEFMSHLSTHPEQSLRFLCFRLDFNEHYSINAKQPNSPLRKY